VVVHLAGKHAAKLEAVDAYLEVLEIARYFIDGRGVFLLDGQTQEFCGVGETGGQLVQLGDYLFQPGAFLAERLRTLGFVPDRRFFELATDFRQAFGFALVVKDTPLTPPCVP
jgi:hypothetical protein